MGSKVFMDIESYNLTRKNSIDEMMFANDQERNELLPTLAVKLDQRAIHNLQQQFKE